jgi:heat shock protein HtpX
MFYSLPAETVFEAKEKNRRATLILFGVLILIYVFFANLFAVPLYWLFRSFGMTLPSAPSMATYTTVLAVVLAAGHFVLARHQSLDNLLSQIGAKPADPQDQYHAPFIHIVQEVESATGIQGIRPVVLASTGLNAFSMEDGRRQTAIGITEGLLTKLNRAELSAVIAHEAAHLLHEDSRLVTTACFLFGAFKSINAGLSRVMFLSPHGVYSMNGYSSRRRSSGGFTSTLLALWLISGVGYLATKLIFMAISREREYLADADGVQMCKDPLAMAESLYKISHRYRGGFPTTFAALFIMNPEDSDLDEGEGWCADLFSAHPPMDKRLKKLLDWAKSDVAALQSIDEQEERGSMPTAASPRETAPMPNFMIYQNGQWVGPYSPAQLMTLGLLTPSSWICLAGSQEVAKASENPFLLPLFQNQVAATVSSNTCPRCKVSLIETDYEGASVLKCSFCGGHLLRAGVLDRLISRDDHSYSVEEVQKAKAWRDSQRGPLGERDHFPPIRCPLCGQAMSKAIHSYLTQVVIDHCTNDACGTIWCDGGELETIQMLIEDAHQSKN